jgi:hypothetical protein
MTTSFNSRSFNAATTLFDIVLAPPRWFCTEKALCFSPSGIMMYTALSQLPTSMPMNSWFTLSPPIVMDFKVNRLGNTHDTGASTPSHIRI